ncbi:hypothetical protein OAU50_07925 [Planctomycetota bacterium]|nr:hypothetical protein [Planctomycetota bacterium]
MSEVLNDRRLGVAGWLVKAAWMALVCGVIVGAQPVWAADADASESEDAAATEDSVADSADAAPAEEKPEGLFTKLGSIFNPYGFVQLDAAWDDSRFGFNPQLPGFVLSEDQTAGQAPKDESEFTMYTRLARLGFDLSFGTVEDLGDVVVGGKVEVDFYGGGSDSRNLLRMRKAYLTMKWDDLTVLAGQTSDLIAPRYASVNYDLVMWGAGNLGDRRPQLRVTNKWAFGDMTLDAAIMLGLTGAIDGQDLDSNGLSDGAQAALPTIQARVGFGYKYLEEGKALEVGIWGHWAQEEIDGFSIGTGNENQFDSWAVGMDIFVPIMEDWLWVHGEMYTGSNLDDVRGGIFQGVNANGEEIASSGGWGEIGVKPYSWMTVTVGGAIDDPDATDLPAAGRVRNEIFFMKANFAFGPVYFGMEYLYWETEYKAFGAGRANRFKGYVGYKF